EEQSDHMNKKSGNKEKPGSKDAVLPFAPNNETSSAGRQLSLEDTLTPINFKEYSIDPALDQTEKDKEEFVEEEKKPSFVAKPGLMESDTPYQEKKENTLAVTKKSKFTSKREWEEQEKKQIPKWARIFWLPATLIFVLFAGLIIGHSIIGKQPVGDIFDIDMWIHIYKLMYG
ncbi:MAG: DNA-directed RNA polymerase subunit beta, partial [Thermoactinomyces sp.]